MGALLGRASGWALPAMLAGGALIASHTGARVVFAVSGAAALAVALVSTVLLLRAGVDSGLRVRLAVPGFAGAPVEIGETRS